VGWGPRLRREEDSLRSFDSAQDSEVAELLAGDHAIGVTASQNGSKRIFARFSNKDNTN